MAVDRRDPLLKRLAEAAKAEEQARDSLRLAQRRVAAVLREIKTTGTSSRLAARTVLRAVGSPLDHALVEREAARLRKMTRTRNSSHQRIGAVSGEHPASGAESMQESSMDHRILKRRTVTEEWVEQPLDFDPETAGDDDYEEDELGEGEGPLGGEPLQQTRPRRERR